LRTAALAATACALLAGCGSGGAAGPGASVPPGCETAAPDAAQALPASLPRPSGQMMAAETRSAEGTSIVQGFVGRLPSEVLRDLVGRPGLRVLDFEDEGNDAELTVTDGRTRTAYKLVRACATGSRFTAVMVPEPGPLPAAP
jgi:hypothetical protein